MILLEVFGAACSSDQSIDNKNCTVQKDSQNLQLHQTSDSVPFSYPPDNAFAKLTDCYRDHSLPVINRKVCFQKLVDSYGRSYKFREVALLGDEYKKYFGGEFLPEDYDLSEKMDSCKQYVVVIDSLDQLIMSEDSMYYYKTRAYFPVCFTSWFCSETCAPCNLTFIDDKMKSFLSLYPQSKLRDNAEWYLFEGALSLGYELDEDLLKYCRRYEQFLSKHPEFDEKEKVLSSILACLQEVDDKKRADMRSYCRHFIRTFGDSKYALEVKKLTEE